MSGHPPQKSHAGAWTFGAICIVVLYFLSVPIVVARYQGAPDWLRYYVAPYNHLQYNTPLADPLRAYWNYWCLPQTGPDPALAHP
jgi:hypothetical protein